MTEPYGSRKQQERPRHPRTESFVEDGRAISMGTMSKKLYDENGKADYRDITVFVDGQSPTGKSQSKQSISKV